MISLALTTYNRSKLTIEAFTSVLNNDYINEVVIVDDCSEEQYYKDLVNLINKLNNDKIKVFRNDKNMGPLLNKHEAVSKCKNEWLILLDSDNKITNEYIEVIKTVSREENMIYLPEKLLQMNNEIFIDYSKISGIVIDNNNIMSYFKFGDVEAALNTGNYFVNRNSYIDTIKNSTIEKEFATNDALYFSYLWISNGNKINVVKDLFYYHRYHSGSWYLTNQAACESNTRDVWQKIKDKYV